MLSDEAGPADPEPVRRANHGSWAARSDAAHRTHRPDRASAL